MAYHIYQGVRYLVAETARCTIVGTYPEHGIRYATLDENGECSKVSAGPMEQTTPALQYGPEENLPSQR